MVQRVVGRQVVDAIDMSSRTSELTNHEKSFVQTGIAAGLISLEREHMSAIERTCYVCVLSFNRAAHIAFAVELHHLCNFVGDHGQLECHGDGLP